jgi:hypothetical protein
MIASEIASLEKYILNNVKCNCYFGLKDNDPNTYPLVNIRMVEDFELHRGTEKLLTIILPLELRTIVPEGEEHRALEVFERLLLKMNQFNAEKGNEFEGTGTPEYVEETRTFEISLPYTLKLIIQDT